MFDLKEWVKSGLIQGYESGEFSRPGIITMTANYIIRGLLTEADAAEIDAACPEPESIPELAGPELPAENI